MSTTLLINTLLQRGARTNEERVNRFNGFSRATETVETVSARSRLNTPLKQGVNEMNASRFNTLTFLTL
jgi:hypothetical protein